MPIKIWWLIIVLSCGNVAAQQKSPHDWRLVAEVGTETDSSVIVDELDIINETRNDAISYRLSARYRYLGLENQQITFSYAFSDKNYDETDQLDSELQLVSGAYRYEFDDFTLGARGQVVRSELGGNDFLEIEQISPYLSFFLDKKWFVNLSYRYANKDVVNNLDRTGKTHLLSGDIYYFIKGTNQFWQLSARRKQEKANAAPFQYDESSLRLTYVHSFDWFDWDNEVRLSHRYLIRDYDEAPDPVSNIFREDKRHVSQIRITSQINEHLYTEIRYQHSDNNSNIAAQDYDQNSLSFLIGVEY